MKTALAALAALAFTMVAVIGGSTVQGSGDLFNDSVPSATWWTWDGS